MITNFQKKISTICKRHKIHSDEIDNINVNILKQLHDAHQISIFLENHIAYLIEKYNINQHTIYNLPNEIWKEIVNFKFNNPDYVISIRLKRKKVKF